MMLGRNLLRTAAGVSGRGMFSKAHPIGFRMFCAKPPEKLPETIPLSTGPAPDEEAKNATVETVLSEDPQFAYKHKIMTQIVKDKELEETEVPPVKPVVVEIKDKPTVISEKPAEPVPEKDVAFQEKKTTLWQKIKVGMIHLKHSFIDIWKDTKYISKVVWLNGFNESKYTLKQMQDRRRISMDLIKFVPYAILIILPGGELLFPPYFMMFPNSTPTQFLTANSLGERKKVLSEKQAEGYTLFVRSMPTFARVLNIDDVKLFESLSYIHNTEGLEKEEQYFKADDFEKHIKAFLANPRRQSLETQLNLNKLNSYELEQLCKIFYFEYVPGTVWVNLVYGIFFKFPFWLIKTIAKLMKVPKYNRFINHPLYKFKFTLDNGPLAIIKKYLLLAQLRFHINQLRKQDRVLSKDPQELAKIPQMQRIDFARQRAIRIEPNAEIVKYVQDFWLPLSQRKDIPVDTLIWIAVLRYKYTNILV